MSLRRGLGEPRGQHAEPAGGSRGTGRGWQGAGPLALAGSQLGASLGHCVFITCEFN